MPAGERLPLGRKGSESPEGRMNVNIGFRYTNNCHKAMEPEKGEGEKEQGKQGVSKKGQIKKGQLRKAIQERLMSKPTPMAESTTEGCNGVTKAK